MREQEAVLRSAESARELLTASFLLCHTMNKQDAGLYVEFIHESIQALMYCQRLESC